MVQLKCLMQSCYVLASCWFKPRLQISAIKLFSTFKSESNSEKAFPWGPNSKLIETDLIEKYAKGGGPGGQSVNKSANKVQLTHIPTGISVQCHWERDLTTNRARARKILKDKLDFLANGSNSKLGKRIDKIRKRKKNAAKRAKKKYNSNIGGNEMDLTSISNAEAEDVESGDEDIYDESNDEDEEVADDP